MLMSQRWCRQTCQAAFVATVMVLAGTNSSAAAAAPALALSSPSGPRGGGSMITGTSAVSAFPAGTAPTVQFQYFGSGSTSCGATAKAVTQVAGTGTTTTAGVLTVDPAMVVRITTTKIAFQVPSSAYPALDADGNASTVNPDGLVLVGSQTSAKWNVCVYDSDSTTSSTLLATATYTLAVRPIITSITPTSSPAAGGQSITVNGAGFSPASTAIGGSIGGVPLTGIKVASNGNSFTATTGPRTAATDLALTVNTPGGAVTSLDPDNDGQPQDGTSPIPFTYSNGITIAPNTAASGTTVSIDVNGAGFSELTFDSPGTPTSNNAHVFLVKDAYAMASNRGVAECAVAVVSDTELICTLDLSADQLSPLDSSTVVSTPIADGAYILTVVADGATDAGSGANPTIISSGSTFTVAPY